MGDVNVSEEPSSKKNKFNGFLENNEQVLTISEILVPPPLVDNGKPGYIHRVKRFARPSIAKNKASKYFLVKVSRHQSITQQFEFTS
jgi:hypothetical protein